MTRKPDWLPEMVSVGGDWDNTLIHLYKIFEEDFKLARRTFKGMMLWWDQRILEGAQYEEGFWHLITKGERSGDRVFDPRRGERLPWCGPTISHSDDDSTVKVWDFREGNGRIRTYVWLEDWDYVIILQKKERRRGTIVFLVTAFHVDGDSTRRSLRVKFGKREES